MIDYAVRTPKDTVRIMGGTLARIVVKGAIKDCERLIRQATGGAAEGQELTIRVTVEVVDTRTGLPWHADAETEGGS